MTAVQPERFSTTSIDPTRAKQRIDVEWAVRSVRPVDGRVLVQPVDGEDMARLVVGNGSEGLEVVSHTVITWTTDWSPA